LSEQSDEVFNDFHFFRFIIEAILNQAIIIEDEVDFIATTINIREVAVIDLKIYGIIKNLLNLCDVICLLNLRKGSL
jgi:hypothetical protein